MAIELFGKSTGAYEAVFSNDLENFKYNMLKTFDAVPCDTPAALARSASLTCPFVKIAPAPREPAST